MNTCVALLLLLMASETAFSVSENQDLKPFGKAINEFGLGIHRIIADKCDGNFFFSPLCIGVPFGMLYSGSQGKTAEVMRAALGYDQEHLRDSEVYSHFKNLMEIYKKSVVNAVFAQKNYSTTPEYKERLLRYFHATVRDVDFQNEGDQTVKKIKDCVEDSTDNEIKKLLGYDYFDESTVMVLLITGLVPDMWKTECATSDMVFYNNGSPDEKTKVKMIHIVGEFRSVRLGNGILLKIPFYGEKTAMVAYLPDAMDGAKEAEQNLNSNVALAALKQADKDWFNVSIPSLDYTTESILGSVLDKLGIPVCGKSTDEAGGTCVSEVIDTERVKFDPKGSTVWGFAAVVTQTGRRSGEKKVLEEINTSPNEQGSEPSEVTGMEGGFKEVKFDHPYLLTLVDEENDIIYLQGRVCEFEKNAFISF